MVSDDGSPYASDEPIQSKEADRFNRWPFAARIADTIARRKDPGSLVIGVYGPWGDGKTSTLRLMEQALQTSPNVVVLRFNPWQFGSEQQLLQGFFDSLAAGLGRSLSTKKEEIGKLLKKYGSILSVASASVPFVEISPGEAVTGLGEALSAIEIDELRARLEAILRESKKRVVVLIDDIDRLDRSEIQALFKLVKLSASIEHTSYVLAFDDEMVAAALGERYGDGGSSAGRSFLEKIVQVPLHLPPVEQIELRVFAFDGINAALSLAGIEFGRELGEAFAHHFVSGLESQMQTPRQAKRYANALTFALPLLKGEVHTADQMLIEGVRVFYPKLYSAIRNNPTAFLKAARDGEQRNQKMTRARALVESALEDTGVSDVERVWGGLIEPLFPRTRNVGYGSDFEEIWAREQRICSAQYFQRFFSYAVPPGDVGDLEIQKFLEDLRDAGWTRQMTTQRLQALANRRAIPRVVEKLRAREKAIDRGTARSLAIAVAQNGAILPREEGPMVFGGTLTQAGILCAHLLYQLPAEEREQLAHEIIAEAEPLPFAAECMTWMQPRKDKAEWDQVLPASAIETLGNAFAERIRNAAAAKPLFESFPKDAKSLYYWWREYRGREEVAESITRWLQADKNAVIHFLDGFVGRAWGLESGLSSRSDFERDQYNSVVSFVDPLLVMERLRDLYGTQIDNATLESSRRDFPAQERMAREFVAVHRFVTQTDDPDSSDSVQLERRP